jgi:hypothetical protein
MVWWVLVCPWKLATPSLYNIYCKYSRHESSGPASLHRSVEGIWEEILCSDEFLVCIYICPLYMRCHAPILFTCIIVLSRLVIKGECMCEIWIVGRNNKLLGGPRQIRRIQAEVGNVTSKRNAVTRYRFSHVIRAITIKSDNVSYESRAITIRSDNGFYKPRAITTKSDNFSPQCWSIMQ